MNTATTDFSLTTDFLTKNIPCFKPWEIKGPAAKFLQSPALPGWQLQQRNAQRGHGDRQENSWQEDTLVKCRSRWVWPTSDRALHSGGRWLPNMLHVFKPHTMPYSWVPPFSHKRCRSRQESDSLSADLSGERSRTITSDSINLGRALCQLKVKGAIIWARLN